MRVVAGIQVIGEDALCCSPDLEFLCAGVIRAVVAPPRCFGRIRTGLGDAQGRPRRQRANRGQRVGHPQVGAEEVHDGLTLCGGVLRQPFQRVETRKANRRRGGAQLVRRLGVQLGDPAFDRVQARVFGETHLVRPAVRGHSLDVILGAFPLGELLLLAAQFQLGQPLAARGQEKGHGTSGAEYHVARRPEDFQPRLVGGGAAAEQRQQQPERAESDDDQEQPGHRDGAGREDLAQAIAEWGRCAGSAWISGRRSFARRRGAHCLTLARESARSRGAFGGEPARAVSGAG